ncbi:hypothetical protein JX266_006335 [Neoarthrinium moseri]|nr:hypothetical protein JX266_006335 [Neoarthrinium moseri]
MAPTNPVIEEAARSKIVLEGSPDAPGSTLDPSKNTAASIDPMPKGENERTYTKKAGLEQPAESAGSEQRRRNVGGRKAQEERVQKNLNEYGQQ